MMKEFEEIPFDPILIGDPDIVVKPRDNRKIDFIKYYPRNKVVYVDEYGNVYEVNEKGRYSETREFGNDLVMYKEVDLFKDYMVRTFGVQPPKYQESQNETDFSWVDMKNLWNYLKNNQ